VAPNSEKLHDMDTSTTYLPENVYFVCKALFFSKQTKILINNNNMVNFIRCCKLLKDNFGFNVLNLLY
jgi:hypothetical protein